MVECSERVPVTFLMVRRVAQRASCWQAAHVALRMPAQDRDVAAATDGELWARRAAYARETTWAPPYVAGELRDAHIAEDGYREQLTQIADARRAWNAATEASRQRALMADTELRCRHPDVELPPLHPPEEARGSGTAPETMDPDVEAQQSEPSEPGHRVADVEAGPEPGSKVCRTEAARLDIKAALEAAHRAQDIIAERGRQPDREAELAATTSCAAAKPRPARKRTPAAKPSARTRHRAATSKLAV